MTGVWTRQDLTTLAAALHGSPVGALAALAAQLDVDERTMRRWSKGAPIPAAVVREIEELAGPHAPPETRWRRDEWIIGDGAARADGRREYIIHTWPPRFRCRAVEVDIDTGLPVKAELPADILGGLTYAAPPDTVLAEFDWIDRAPTGQALVSLLEAALNALDRSGDV